MGPKNNSIISQFINLLEHRNYDISSLDIKDIGGCIECFENNKLLFRLDYSDFRKDELGLPQSIKWKKYKTLILNNITIKPTLYVHIDSKQNISSDLTNYYDVRYFTKFDELDLTKWFVTIIINNHNDNNHNDNNHNNICKMLGLIGLPVIHNNPLPNCINYNYDDLDNISYLVTFVYNNYYKYRNTIKESVINYITHKPKIKNVVIMASHHREKILDINISLMKKNDNIDEIIIPITNKEDVDVCFSHNISYCRTKNQPLGEKWQHGVILSKIYNPKYIIIMGSDDFIFPNYVKDAINLLEHNNLDIYIQNSWIIYDISNEKYFELKYMDDTKGLGAGRIISTNILDKINWQLYPTNFSFGLDSYSNDNLNSVGGKFMINNENVNANTIFCPKYDVNCMNPIGTIKKNMAFTCKEVQLNSNNELFKSDLLNIKNAFIAQHKIDMKRNGYIVVSSSNIDITSDNVFRTTSLSDIIFSDFDVRLIIKIEKGTPGIFINNIDHIIEKDKLYKVDIDFIGDYPLSLFLAYINMNKKPNANANINKQIKYNKHNLINGSTFISTVELTKINRLYIYTQVPKQGELVIKKITISEIIKN